MKKLSGKVAVVTGGSSGIGYAAAQDLINNGASVVITGRNEATLHQAADAIGATAIPADQGKVPDIERLAAEVENRFEKVDVLFINAGIAAFAPIEQVTEDALDQMMDINFKGAFFTLQKFLPLLETGASVITLSSVNATAAMPNTVAYGASKAALNAFTKIAAYELASKGIRVNSISPGPVNTPIFGKMGLPEEAISEFAAAMQERVPLHRFGQPEDIAKLVTFLASDDASFVTGSDYVIDGGAIINPIVG